MEDKYLNLMSNRTRVSSNKVALLGQEMTPERKQVQKIEEKYLKMEEESPYKSNFNQFYMMLAKL